MYRCTGIHPANYIKKQKNHYVYHTQSSFTEYANIFKLKNKNISNKTIVLQNKQLEFIISL